MNGVIEALYIYDEHNNPVLSHTYTGRPLSAAQLLPLYLEQQRLAAAPMSSASSSAPVAMPAAASAASLSSSSARAAPPASLVCITASSPPTLVFSMVHASNLLFLLTAVTELEPLLALEFLRRVADVLEEFVGGGGSGSGLSAGKIEGNCDVVAQLLTEMCDAGSVATTEPNALRDLVEVEGLVGKLLGSMTLPSGLAAAAAAAATAATSGPGAGAGAASSLHHRQSSSLNTTSFSSSSSSAAANAAAAAAAASALPWRRANVRHTSNELYADVVESLSVTLAPSGRPLAAFAHGSIAFTSKVSGLPDILLRLATTSAASATSNARRRTVDRLVDLPVFHPCVRLARWKERPGELSFIPPDGRFLLAAYEVDLLGGGDGDDDNDYGYLIAPNASSSSSSSSSAAGNLRLPVSVDIQTGLGPTGADFAVRVQINRSFAFGASGRHAAHRPTGGDGGGSGGGGGGGGGGGALAGLGTIGSSLGGGPHPGSPGAPLLEDVHITVPLPADVRNVLEIRPSRGDAAYSPGDRVLEWQIPSKDIAAGTPSFGLRCTVVGQPDRGDDEGEDDIDDDTNDDGGEGQGTEDGGHGAADDYGFGFQTYTYDEPQPYQQARTGSSKKGTKGGGNKKQKSSSSNNNNNDSSHHGQSPEEAAAAARHSRQRARNSRLMPRSASVSFSVKGWLASGLRIDSIVLDAKRSRGLGEGVKPFKGVKYLTVSKGAVELRC